MKDNIKRYVFVSNHGDAFFLAYIMQKQGKEVYFYTEDPEARAIGEHMLENRVDDFHEVLLKYPNKDETLLIFDQTGLGAEAELLLKQGYHVYGGSLIADRLEEDRAFATKLLSQAVGVPPTKTFNTFNEAKEFLKTQDKDKRFVFKPSGENVPSDWTYVAHDVADLVSRLNYYEAEWTATDISFQLQTFIQGIECDFSGYFSRSGQWIKDSFVWYFEDKKFMNGNLGPNIGCADAFQYFTTEQEPYFKEHLSKFTKFLKKNNYSGQFSVNNIYDPKTKKFYALEISPRMGYDSFQNEIYHLVARKKDPALLLKAVALGIPLPKNYFDPTLYNFNVRISIPPYPNETHEPKQSQGHVVDMERSIEKNFYYGDVKYDEKTHKVVCTGSDHVVGVICTLGKEINGVISDLYLNIAPKLNIAHAQYRTDGGRRVAIALMQLTNDKKILKRQDNSLIPLIVKI